MTTFLSPGQVLPAPTATASSDEWDGPNLNNYLMCPECRIEPPNIVEDYSAGDTICSDCGMVLDSRLVDQRSEWRTFANDESGGDDPSRVGQASNPLEEGLELQTGIAFEKGDARSRDLNRAQSKLHNEKSKKNYSEVFARMGTFAEVMKLDTKTINWAKHAYQLSARDPRFKTKNTDAIIAGCIFVACRQTKNPRTFREISSVTRISKKEIGKMYKMLQDFLKREKGKTGKEKSDGPPSMIPGVTDGYQEDMTSATAYDYVDRFCSRLAMKPDAAACSRSIANRVATVAVLAGKSPLSIAAACIYMGSHLLGNPKSPKEIAKVATVSESTIRSSYKSLLAQKDAVIEPRWVEKAGGTTDKLPSA